MGTFATTTVSTGATRLAAILVFLLLAAPSPAQQAAPLEVYGALPEVSHAAISPDGRLVAYREIRPDRDVVRVVDVDRMRPLRDIDVSRVKPWRLTFIDNAHLVLVASEYSARYGEVDQAFLFDVNDGLLFPLLLRAEDLAWGDTGIGDIVGRTASGDRLLMAAWIDDLAGNAQYGLYAVETDKRVSRIFARGRHGTVDWFIDAEGQPLIREDFDNNIDKHWIWSVSGPRDVLLFEQETEERVVLPIGLSADREELVLRAYSEETDSYALYMLDVETGDMSGPVLGKEDRSIQRALLDVDRVVHGVEYEGFYPTYRFWSPELTARMAEIQQMLGDTSVRLVDWSEDFERLVVLASGGWTSGVYLLFTEGETQPALIARQRPQIAREQVAPTIVTQYEARDGLPIPALVTGYPQVIEDGNAPLIVMPHGGPESFDRADFDWLAQYLASRGYVVLQPQFRGSTGFGESHVAAGEGEWGRKMQTDLDDGVAWLVGQEIVDSERVCIVGSSYGGYAALAAGAFSPALYRCHVSINGISDIRRMLTQDVRWLGPDHWVVAYWEDWYGADSRDRDELDALSPRNFAEEFRSSVLLIHGRDDTVIDPEQSRIMRTALRRAGKEVTLEQIRGGDHWLSQPETRIEVLMLLTDFLEEHL